jgi:hypothetical protein
LLCGRLHCWLILALLLTFVPDGPTLSVTSCGKVGQHQAGDWPTRIIYQLFRETTRMTQTQEGGGLQQDDDQSMENTDPDGDPQEMVHSWVAVYSRGELVKFQGADSDIHQVTERVCLRRSLVSMDPSSS